MNRLINFCEERTEFDDVAAVCRPLSKELVQPCGTVSANDEVVFGDVYLLKCGRNYKIGHSNSSGRRERELAIQLPEKVKLVHVIKTDDPCGIERYWHERFSSKRKNGEWFELSAEEVLAFKRRRGFM